MAWWLALVGALIVTVPTAVTGLIDWLKISRGSALWRTATAHLVAMLSSTVIFLVAAVIGHDGYVEHEVSGGALTLTLIGFAVLTLGGWLGGTVVFVHGMRVVNDQDAAASEAVVSDASSDGTQETEERSGLTRY